MAESAIPTFNFLVPQDGTTHSVRSQFLASATPYQINWAGFNSANNIPFRPQGFRIDTTLCSANTIITLLPIGMSMTIPKSVVAWYSFPAPEGQTVAITGNGPCIIDWVNFPVVAQDNSIDAAILNALLNPVIQPPPAPTPPSPVHYTRSAGANNFNTTDASMKPSTLMFNVSVSSNATIAAAGLLNIIVANGSNLGTAMWFYNEDVYLTNANTNVSYNELRNFPAGFSAPTNGNFYVFLSTPLTAGEVSFACWSY